MYDKQVVRRRRAVLAVLVVLSIVLLTGYFGEGNGGFLHGLQHGAQVVLNPIESGASRAFKPVRDGVNWFGDVFDAKSQNKRLKSELASERSLLAQSQTAMRDNAEFRGLLGLSKTPGYPQDIHPVTAEVTAKNPQIWYSTIAIDKGSSDGVRRDQPVVASGGLIGKVASVTSDTADVTLITDPSSAVSAEVTPGGAQGVVRPAVGNPDDMRLEFIQQGGSIKPGDSVVTSGFVSGNLQSLFPRGIPIGRVTRVSSDELQLYQLVHMQPYADLREMDYVQVLTGVHPTNTNLPGNGP